jgi:murein DD-endopeptidase MepM/ murein hydrolase activator NlpD
VGTYGADSGVAGYYHGDDIFGELGQPLLAVAGGTVFSVGWNRSGGNRLWLRDHQGNLFYYAHLAAFSTSVRNGARVKAGQVVGFMGNTGDARGAGTHLQFEVHPVSLIYLGYDGGVDPSTYLQSWRRLRNLPFPLATGWAPSPPGVVREPEPGALLIGSTDIATGGLGAAKP